MKPTVSPSPERVQPDQEPGASTLFAIPTRPNRRLRRALKYGHLLKAKHSQHEQFTVRPRRPGE